MARHSLYPNSITPGIPKIGNIPDGWILTTFGDLLAPVKRPVKLADDKEYQLVIARRSRGGIAPRSRFLGKDIKTKSQFRIHNGDFLIAKRQIIHGACGVVPADLNGAIVSGEYSVLEARDGLLMDFLRHYTHSIHFQQTCFHSSVGVDVEKMIFRIDEWYREPVCIPPLPEQARIAEILDIWDQAIELTGRLIAALKKRKMWLMQRLLTGDVRFPEFRNDTAPKSTKYGSIPGDWYLVHVDDVASVNAKSLPSNGSEGRSFSYIDIASVSEGEISYPEDKIEYSCLPSRARRTPRKNDVLMATVRPHLLAYAIIDFEPDDLVCSTGFAVLSPRLSSDAQFLYQQLYSTNIQRQLHSLVTGSNYPAVSAREVERLKVVWPDTVDERASIGRVLKLCNDEIDTLKDILHKYQLQKKGLMQRLLTGQVRVSVD